MALTINNVVGVDNESVGDPRAYNAGTATNRILVVVASISFADSNNITGITYNGVALTRAGTQDDPYNYTTAEVWYLLSPPSGSNSLQVTSTDDTVVSIIMAYVSADGAISVGNTAGGQGDSTTATGTITPQASGSMLVAGVVSNTDGSMSATGGSTERAETNAPDSGLQTTGMYTKSTSGTGSQSIAATVPNDGWAIEVVEIKEATAQSVTAPHISSAAVILTPIVLYVVAAPMIATASVLYAPTLSAAGNSLVIPLLTNTSALYLPTVLRGAVALLPPSIDSVSAINAPSLAHVLAVGHIAAASVLFAPSLSVGAITLQTPYLAAGNALYTPNVTQGGVTLSIPFIDSTSVLFGSTIRRAVSPTELLLLGVG